MKAKDTSRATLKRRTTNGSDKTYGEYEAEWCLHKEIAQGLPGQYLSKCIRVYGRTGMCRMTEDQMRNLFTRLLFSKRSLEEELKDMTAGAFI